MNKIILLSALVCLTILSCKNEDEAKKTTKENSHSINSESGFTCYSKQDRDTIVLSFRNISDSVVGTLDYHISQKDKNTGFFYGRFSGDTLFAEFVFESEGMNSRRQMAFLKKDDNLVEGFGPIEEKGNRQYFTDKSQIRFDSGIELKKTSCTN